MRKVILLTLNYVLEALTGSPIDLSRLVITEATVDSRQVIPGAMFVALPGERTDGHNFVEEAFKNGASIALVQRDMPAEFVTLDLTRASPHSRYHPAHRHPQRPALLPASGRYPARRSRQSPPSGGANSTCA